MLQGTFSANTGWVRLSLHILVLTIRIAIFSFQKFLCNSEWELYEANL